MAMAKLELVKPISDTIPEYFTGKNVFITGFTGFLGKYHVAKLLTDCPTIGTIYVLLRSRKGMSMQERFEYTLKNQIFHHLKEEQPSLLKKIVPLEGDLMQLNMGLSEENRKTLIDNVSIVYHIAATVRFDMALADAIILNVRGTRELCHLVLDMNKCEAFSHVSTAYCQLHSDTVEEKRYPSPVNWREAIEIAEKLERFEMDILCRKYSDGYPNTYTFTKAIAEEVVNELCGKRVPCIIFRPTIVIGAYEGIYPGWVDNFNGPTGLFLAQGKGVFRIIFGSKDGVYDIVPVDYVINTLIKGVWMQQYLRPNEVSYYNCSNYNNQILTLDEMIEHGRLSVEKAAIEPIWHIEYNHTDNWFVYYINILLFHVLPGVFIDFFLKFLGNKPMYVKIQRKVYVANLALQYFTSNHWAFLNHKCEELDDYLQPSDKQAFYLCMTGANISEFIVTSSHYIKKYMLMEKPTTLEAIKRKRLIMCIAHNFMKYTAFLMLSIFVMNGILLPMLEAWNAYWKSL